MRVLYVIAHDMRSTFNVGSLLRTAEGLGVTKLFLTGYTPYPSWPGDTRLPHLARKLDTQIHKTALGAENTIAWGYHQDLAEVIKALKTEGVTIAALERHKTSLPLHEYQPPDKLALLLGTEVTGLQASDLKLTDITLEIPMAGQKESFNVVIAAAMALYQFSRLS